MTEAKKREALEAELAELMAKNAAATSWGAAVGARSERIKDIRLTLASLSPSAADAGAEAVAPTESELLYLAGQQGYARSRYHEDDAQLRRESLVIEWALRRAATPSTQPAALGREAIAKALCCPRGCSLPDNCVGNLPGYMSGKTREQIEGIIALLASRSASVAGETGVLQDDLRELLELLGLPSGAQPRSPHDVFQSALVELRKQLIVRDDLLYLRGNRVSVNSSDGSGKLSPAVLQDASNAIAGSSDPRESVGAGVAPGPSEATPQQPAVAMGREADPGVLNAAAFIASQDRQDLARLLFMLDEHPNSGSAIRMNCGWTQLKSWQKAKYQKFADAILSSPSPAALDAGAVKDHLVWSNERRCWWRAESCGYTKDVRAAGRYTREDAIAICRTSRDGWQKLDAPPDELAIPISSLPEGVRAALANGSARP